MNPTIRWLWKYGSIILLQRAKRQNGAHTYTSHYDDPIKVMFIGIKRCSYSNAKLNNDVFAPDKQIFCLAVKSLQLGQVLVACQWICSFKSRHETCRTEPTGVWDPPKSNQQPLSCKSPTFHTAHLQERSWTYTWPTEVMGNHRPSLILHKGYLHLTDLENLTFLPPLFCRNLLFSKLGSRCFSSQLYSI